MEEAKDVDKLCIVALKPLAFFSVTLQSAEADIVMCINNTLKSVAAFTSLLQKDPKEWSMVQLVRSRLKNGSGEDTEGVSGSCCSGF